MKSYPERESYELEKKLFGVFAGTFFFNRSFCKQLYAPTAQVTISFLVQGFMQLNNGQSES